MKATIEFALPEEEALFMTASNAHRYRAAVAAIAQWARGKRKYGTPSVIEAARCAFHEVVV